MYISDEHTPENSVIFLKKFLKWFPFEVKCIQTDNGTEFTYKFISDETKCPFEAKLAELGIEHNRKGVIRTPILRDGFPFSLC